MSMRRRMHTCSRIVHTYEIVGGVGLSTLGGMKGSEQLSSNGFVGLKTASTGLIDTRGWSQP